METTPLLSADALLCGYESAPVCGPVTFDLEPGQILGVVGFNGAGKSTVVRTAIGGQAPIDGESRFKGLLIDDRSAAFRAAVSCVFDQDAFFPSLTVAEHLELVARGHAVAEPDDAVAAELSAFGLDPVADALPNELSSGQRRRLLLASGFIRPAELLVLDEPEQRLDPVMRGVLAQRLATAARSGTAVLLVTHSPELLRASATDCLVIDETVSAVAVDDGAALISGTAA